MSDMIRSVDLVSDGILVSFSDCADGKACYFPASFLLQYIDHGHNQIFLDYDPPHVRPGAAKAVRQSSPVRAGGSTPSEGTQGTTTALRTASIGQRTRA